VPTRRSELTHKRADITHFEEGQGEYMRVSETFGQGQNLLGQREPGAQFSPHQMDGCEVSAREKCLRLRRRILFDPLSERDRSLRGLL
jgi:hypothetical protein